MKAYNRVNRMGVRYTLVELVDGGTEIQLTGKSKKIHTTHDIETISQGWYHYMNGKMVQDAFEFMSSDEREFIMTGITGAEWDAMFKNTEEY